MSEITLVDNSDDSFTINLVDGGYTLTVTETPIVLSTTEFSGVGPRGLQGIQGNVGATGPQGIQGIQGISGFSGLDSVVPGPQGLSGYSGISGATGPQGPQGISGYSGINGAQGVSGYSGIIGADGASGYSGFSGINGIIGANGASGYSGFSGIQGLHAAWYSQATPPVTAVEGDHWVDTDTGNDYTYYYDGNSYQWVQFGVQGLAGLQGNVGPAGTSGYSGISGINGADSTVPGPAGTSGYSGISGATGPQGISGYSGLDGTSVVLQGSVANYAALPGGAAQGDLWITLDTGDGWVSDGVGGWANVGQIQGPAGPSGASGYSGTNGAAGASGFSGINGAQGVSGYSGISGTNGAAGTSGFSGINGSQGVSGYSGISGSNGTAGASGYSGISGTNGAVGTSGYSGISGTNGAVGTSGYSGISGATGPQGTSGYSGISGANGSAGTSGYSGISGATGVSGYSGVATPASGNLSVQYNLSGVFASSTKVKISASSNLELSGINAATTNPAADTVVLLAGNIAGRETIATVNSDVWYCDYQPSLSKTRNVLWQPIGGSTTVPLALGISASTAVGTVTAATQATTNARTRSKRLSYVSAGTSGSLAGLYWPAAGAQFTIGNASNFGGFHAIFRFAIHPTTNPSGSRAFIGFSSGVAAPTNVDPATLTNCFGLAQVAGDTTWRIVYGGSAAQTPINLGTSIGDASVTYTPSTIWQLAFYAPSNQNNVVEYELMNLATGLNSTRLSGTLTGTAGTALPASTTYLAPRAWVCNNATATACTIEICSISIETDY